MKQSSTWGWYAVMAGITLLFFLTFIYAIAQLLVAL